MKFLDLKSGCLFEAGRLLKSDNFKQLWQFYVAAKREDVPNQNLNYSLTV